MRKAGFVVVVVLVLANLTPAFGQIIPKLPDDPHARTVYADNLYPSARVCGECHPKQYTAVEPLVARLRQPLPDVQQVRAADQRPRIAARSTPSASAVTPPSARHWANGATSPWWNRSRLRAGRHHLRHLPPRRARPTARSTARAGSRRARSTSRCSAPSTRPAASRPSAMRSSTGSWSAPTSPTGPATCRIHHQAIQSDHRRVGALRHLPPGPGPSPASSWRPSGRSTAPLPPSRKASPASNAT